MEKEFKFLEEKPLENNDDFLNSKFGHEEISSALSKIISNCPAPFTIGLFGKWGAGKSTIANSIKNKLLPNNIAVVIFDVWKHEGDALRRTFLKECDRQLKELGDDYFDTSFKLDEKLDQSVSRTSEGKFHVNREKIEQLLKMGGYTILVILFFGYIAFKCNYLTEYWNLLCTVGGTIAGIAGGVGLGTWLIEKSVHLFSTETVTFGVDKLQDPHQFETEFSNILNHLKHVRLLIVFDNLDRVTHDKAILVLSTIKTFLEPRDEENKNKEAIFLVPCDARAIKNHVANVYRSNGSQTPFSPDEFLRKFFNTVIWIPDFFPGELENFARDSLQRTGVIDLNNNEVAWIITKAFRENPRQIIQFTNILLANYLLVKEREEKGDLADGFAKENIPQLAKYLILSELFPEEMEILRVKKIISIKDFDGDDLETNRKVEFLKFIRETEQDIPIDNLRLFFTLRRSEHEKKLPGVENLISLLEDKKIEESEKYFSELGNFSDPQLKEDLSQIVKAELENKINPVSVINFIDTLFDLLVKRNIVLSATAYVEINNKLTGSCLMFMHSVNPSSIALQLLDPFSNYRFNIIEQWLVVLEDHFQGVDTYNINNIFVENVLKVIADNSNYLIDTQLNRIKKLLEEKLTGNEVIADIFINDIDKQKIFITPEYVKKLLESIPDNSPELIQQLNRLAKIESNILKSVSGDSLISKLSSLQNVENQDMAPDRYTVKENIVTAVIGLINSQEDVFATTTELIIDDFITNILAGINGIPDYNNKRIYYPLLVLIESISSDSKKIEINAQLQSFFSNANSDSIDYVLDKVKNPNEFIEQGQYKTLESRSLDDQSFFEYFFGKLSEVKKEELLDKLFDVDIARTIQFAEKISYKLPNLESFALKALSKFDSLPSAVEKRQMLDLVVILKGVNNTVKNLFAEKVMGSLATTNTQLQDISHASLIAAQDFLDDTLKRKIVKYVFDWLKQPEVTKYQESTIRSIYALKSQFNDEEDKEFLQFIFEELIRKTSSVNEINFGLDLLFGIMPKYEERQQNFDDIKIRLETEQDVTISKALVVGLKKIRPKNLNQKNKNYWEWVDSLNNE